MVLNKHFLVFSMLLLNVFVETVMNCLGFFEKKFKRTNNQLNAAMLNIYVNFF